MREYYIFLKISLRSILLHALVHTPPGHFKQHDGQGLGRCTEIGPVKRTTVGGCGAGGGIALICRFLIGTGAGGGRLREPPSCLQPCITCQHSSASPIHCCCLSVCEHLQHVPTLLRSCVYQSLSALHKSNWTAVLRTLCCQLAHGALHRKWMQCFCKLTEKAVDGSASCCA